MPDLDQYLAIADRRIARMVGQLDKELAAIYRQVAEEVRSKLGVIFERYASGDVLTPAELERYGRMDAIERELDAISDTGSARARETIRNNQDLIYRAGVEQYRWAVEQGLGRTLPWGRIDQAAVARAIASPLERIAVERLNSNSRERIRSVLARGLVRGDSFSTMAREMRGAINGNAYDALRIARTEAHRIQNEAHLDRTAEVERLGGSVVKVWSSADDGRTRSDHRRMDGKRADKDGMFTLPDGSRGPAPGMTGEPSQDINCRCTYLEIVEIPD